MRHAPAVRSFAAVTSRERLLDGIAVSERRVDAGGVSTAVLEAGSGDPLVLLHGGIECGGAYWAPVVELLAEQARVVVPDVPGLGESEPLPLLDQASFGRWLADLLAATSDGAPTLVAHSLTGGLTARHADGVRALVLYGTPGIGRYRMPVGLRADAMRLALRPSQRAVERLERRAFLDRDGLASERGDWLGAFTEYLRSRAATPHVRRAMRQIVRAGTARVPDAELDRLRAPVALVWGRHDRFVPLTLAERASRRHGWPLHAIERSGHVPHIERPAAFVAAIKEER
jgi:pimeloyl-ACP methyl ester carboxylesterase